jgi:hypothetical protein
MGTYRVFVNTIAGRKSDDYAWVSIFKLQITNVLGDWNSEVILAATPSSTQVQRRIAEPSQDEV